MISTGLVGPAFQTIVDALKAHHGDPAGSQLFLEEETVAPSLTEQVFPAAATLMTRRLQTLGEFLSAVLRHLAIDRPGLADLGLIDQNLVSLNGRLSDSHHGGRQVLKLTFSDGLRLIYKPRSLATDLIWADICDRLNQAFGEPISVPPNVVDAGDHGWSSFVDAEGALTFSASMARRLGIVLATLHRLGSTDMHDENLVFAEQGLVLLDCETLLSPAVDSLAPEFSQRWYDESVLSTNAVSGWQQMADGTWSPTGAIQALLSRGPQDERSRRLGLNALLDGYRLGQEYADRVLPQVFPELLNSLTAVDCRLVARRTAAYGRVLRESLEPQALRTGSGREPSQAHSLG